MAGAGQGFSTRKGQGMHRSFALWMAVASLACALLLIGCTQSGGAGAQQEPVETQPAEVQETDGGGDEQDAPEAAADDESGQQVATEGSAEQVAWNDECTDRHGDVTAYAVAELTGEQLCLLLEQMEYVWSERSQLWVKMDGASALAVRDGKGEALTKDEIAALDVGAVEEAVSYRLITSGYSSAKKALDGLACKILATVDVEYLDDSAVAVVVTPSQQQCLVFACKTNDVYTVTVYSEQALARGLFDVDAGQKLGTTASEVFEALTGRALVEP